MTNLAKAVRRRRRRRKHIKSTSLRKTSIFLRQLTEISTFWRHRKTKLFL